MQDGKRLDGVQAVQTLSRLNRTQAGKEDTFILDFVNEAEDIREAFKPYYEIPVIDQQVDVQQLYGLQHGLAEEQVYWANEVEEFAKVFFRPKQFQSRTDHAATHRILNGPVERFEALSDEKQEQFRSNLIAFRNLYSFMSQIIPFQDADLEKLYAFIRLLVPRLSKRGIGPAVVIDDEVSLRYYRLQQTSEGSIALAAGDRGTVPAPTAVGTGKNHYEQVELSRLINVINDRFGTDFKPATSFFSSSSGRNQFRTQPYNKLP